MTDFVFGMPATGENLYDRAELLDKIVSRLSGIEKGIRNNVVLLGPRRTGKTSVLYACAKQLQSLGIISIVVDCEGYDFPSFLRHYGNCVIDAKLQNSGIIINFVESVKAGATALLTSLSEALGRLKAIQIASSVENYIQFRIEFEQITKSRELTHDELNALFDKTIGLADNLGFPIVVMFDEFQEINTYSLPRGKFLDNFRNAIQPQQNVVYAYSGSSTGLIKDIFSKGPMAGSADIISIDPFSRDISKNFLKAGLESKKVRIDESAAEEVYRFTGGVALYLNWMGLFFLDRTKTGGQVSIDQVRMAEEEMLSPRSPVYHILEKQLNKYGHKLILTLNALSRGHKTTSEIAAEVPNSSTQAIRTYLERLISYGIVSVNKDIEYSILDPVLSAFILKKISD
jgi:AAA+ ATPase superfamily predicted ATPase